MQPFMLDKYRYIGNSTTVFTDEASIKLITLRHTMALPSNCVTSIYASVKLKIKPYSNIAHPLWRTSLDIISI